MRWSLSLSSLVVCIALGFELSLALPLRPSKDFELVPRIKGAEGLEAIPSSEYRQTAKMTSIRINDDGTKTRLQTAEERKKHGEQKFNANPTLEADHGLEKQQIPSFLKANKLGTFDRLSVATQARVNKALNHVNNFAWIPKGLNSSKKHAVEQGIAGKKVKTNYEGRTPYLTAIYNRVKRASKAVQKAVLKDPAKKKVWDNLDSPQDFDRINRQQYEAMGILAPGEPSPASTPGHTPYSSRPPSTIGPSGSSTSLQLPQAGGSTTSLGKHSRSDSAGSSSSDQVAKKAKEGSPVGSSASGSPGNKFAGLPKLNTNLAKSPRPPSKSPQSARSSTPGSTKNKFAGLPKLNTNVMKTASPGSKSPKLASSRASAPSAKSVGDKQKARQPIRKSTSAASPKSPQSVSKSPQSARSSTPGSAKNKFAGLPKLNTKVVKSSSPRPKSPKSASGRARALPAKPAGGKGRQQTPKSANPRSSQANVRKSPPSPKSRGASPKSPSAKSPSPKSPSRSPIRGGPAAKPKVVLPKRAAKRGGKS